MIRSHLYHLPAKIAGYCSICGAAGNHYHYDYDFRGAVCESCVQPILLAEQGLAELAGCDQPPLPELHQ